MSRTRLSSSRGRMLTLALLIVMVEAAFPQRVTAQWRSETLLGARFGPPLRAGLAVGVVYGNRSRIAEFAGPIVIAEAGLGGGRLSAGYLLAFPFVSGVEVLGSAVRTWGSPWNADANTTMLGGELRAIGFAVNVGFGAFRRVGGVDGESETRYYMNIGLGI